MPSRYCPWVVIAFLAAGAPCFGQAGDNPFLAGLLRSSFDTSAPAVAPPWSLRPWFWEDDVNTAGAVWDLVNGCRDHDLPLGAVLIDSP